MDSTFFHLLLHQQLILLDFDKKYTNISLHVAEHFGDMNHKGVHSQY